MRQASNQFNIFIIVNSSVAALPPRLRALHQIIAACEDGVIAHVECCSPEEKTELTEILLKENFIKLFEDTWASIEFESSSNSTLISKFFGTIAEEYEEIIERSWNISCYDYLYLQAVAENEAPQDILDVGCGTGLIVESAFFCSAKNVFGYDQSGEMLLIAQRRGLRTIASLPDLYSRKYDLVICSYVLHYMISEGDFWGFVNSLMCGGKLVANVHKNIGLARYRELCLRLSSAEYKYEFTPSPYGSILIVERLAT